MNIYPHIWQDLKGLYGARYEPENIRPLAGIYWRAMLSISLMLIVVSLGWGAWTFVVVLSQLSSDTGAGGGKAPVALDRKQLEATLAAYQSRSLDLSTLNASSAPIPDPSK